MADQHISYKQGADSGENAEESIKPYSNAEAVNQTVLRRPTENLRARTETLRTEVSDLKYLADSNTAWLIESDCTFSMSKVGADYTVIATAGNITLRPYNRPRVVTAGTLTLTSPLAPVGPYTESSQLILTSQLKSYEDGNDILVTLQEGTTASVDAPDIGAGEPAPYYITVIYEAGDTFADVEAQINGDANASALIVASTNDPDGDETLAFDVPTTDGRVNGSFEPEEHTFTHVDFNALSPIQIGDTLAVGYELGLIDTAGGPTLGGRRQSYADGNSSEDVSGNLVNLTANPEKIPFAIPICTLNNQEQLVFIDGTYVSLDDAPIALGKRADTAADVDVTISEEWSKTVIAPTGPTVNGDVIDTDIGPVTDTTQDAINRLIAALSAYEGTEVNSRVGADRIGARNDEGAPFVNVLPAEPSVQNYLSYLMFLRESHEDTGASNAHKSENIQFDTVGLNDWGNGEAFGDPSITTPNTVKQAFQTMMDDLSQKGPDLIGAFAADGHIPLEGTLTVRQDPADLGTGPVISAGDAQLRKTEAVVAQQDIQDPTLPAHTLRTTGDAANPSFTVAKLQIKEVGTETTAATTDGTQITASSPVFTSEHSDMFVVFTADPTVKGDVYQLQSGISGPVANVTMSLVHKGPNAAFPTDGSGAFKILPTNPLDLETPYFTGLIGTYSPTDISLANTLLNNPAAFTPGDLFIMEEVGGPAFRVRFKSGGNYEQVDENGVPEGTGHGLTGASTVRMWPASRPNLEIPHNVSLEADFFTSNLARNQVIVGCQPYYGGTLGTAGQYRIPPGVYINSGRIFKIATDLVLDFATTHSGVGPSTDIGFNASSTTDNAFLSWHDTDEGYKCIYFYHKRDAPAPGIVWSTEPPGMLPLTGTVYGTGLPAAGGAASDYAYLGAAPLWNSGATGAPADFVIRDQYREGNFVRFPMGYPGGISGSQFMYAGLPPLGPTDTSFEEWLFPVCPAPSLMPYVVIHLETSDDADGVGAAANFRFQHLKFAHYNNGATGFDVSLEFSAGLYYEQIVRGNIDVTDTINRFLRLRPIQEFITAEPGTFAASMARRADTAFKFSGNNCDDDLTFTIYTAGYFEDRNDLYAASEPSAPLITPL